eukprot:59385-Pleurochrysis_carterae.AAC.4
MAETEIRLVLEHTGACDHNAVGEACEERKRRRQGAQRRKPRKRSHKRVVMRCSPSVGDGKSGDMRADFSLQAGACAPSSETRARKAEQVLEERLSENAQGR